MYSALWDLVALPAPIADRASVFILGRGLSCPFGGQNGGRVGSCSMDGGEGGKQTGV